MNTEPRKFATLRDDLYARSPESRERVAECLSELRAERGVTQVGLAAAVGTPPQGATADEH